MRQIRFIPTEPGLYGVECDGGLSFVGTLRAAAQCEKAGEFDRACALRFDAVSALADALGDEEQELDYRDDEARAAVDCAAASAVDLLLAGEWELSAATAELALSLDSEDHNGVTQTLAWAYLALGDMECYHDIEIDLDERSDYKAVMNLWAALIEKRAEAVTRAVAHLRSRFPEVYEEFRADEHPTTEAYAADLESERPSRATRARRLWLATEVLWSAFPDVVNTLKGL